LIRIIRGFSFMGFGPADLWSSGEMVPTIEGVMGFGGITMKCRYFAAVIAVVAIAGSAQAEEAKRLNVLLIVADDLNCDLGCYGDATAKTPNIDELAAHGIRFERAYCQYPLCSPSRSSFLTGRTPNSTRVLRNPGVRSKDAPDENLHPHFRDALPDCVTLPQLFRNNGYRVERVGKLYHYGVPGQIGTNGLDDPDSWERVFNPKGRDRTDEDRIFSLVPGKFGGVLSWLADDGEDGEQTDGLIAETASKRLAEFSEKKEPFFLGVGFFRPHTPYVAPKPWFAMHPAADVVLPQLTDFDRARLPKLAFFSAQPEQEGMSDELRRDAIQAYHAAISFMDAQVGRVLKAVDEQGLRDSTVIVFMSDHGYHMGDHGLWQKLSLFERSARAPLIISGPNLGAKGHSTESLAALLDLYPTLADLCGLKPPAELEGLSLRPVLVDPTTTVRSAVVTQVPRGKVPGYSVRTARWRYTEFGDGEQGRLLFDETNDPGEALNLAEDPQHADVVKEHRALIRAYVR
jgi:uncharacterized sulfatase